MEFAKMMHVLNNVFLPRKLPQEDLESTLNPGGAFVQLVAREVDDIAKKVPLSKFKEVARMMQRWTEVQAKSVSWKEVHDKITSLCQGETFSLYVRGQNAGLCISSPVVATYPATMAVFRVAANSEEVMAAKGDLIGMFPSWTVKTNVERVQSESFAKQVAVMANNIFSETLPESRKAGVKVAELRDVSNASYMTRWLVLAVAGCSEISGGEDTVRIEKKIRDDILWHRAKQPWRRSGEYMTVKVVLQSMLEHQLGPSNGRISYKLMLIQVMMNILQENYTKLETDVVLQMLSKLARRLSKIDGVFQTVSVLPEILNKGQEIIGKCSKVLVSIRGHIDERWQRIIEREASHRQVVVDTSKLNFVEHIKHLLNNATQHLEEALTTSPQPTPINARDPICCQRNKSKTIPNVDILVSNKAQVDIGEALYDIESWVQNILWRGREEWDTHFESPSLFNLLRVYIKKGKEYYEDDPLGSSRMILATITIVAVLDNMATRKHPLLQNYNHGVNTSILQELLLPHRGDMEHLAALEAYFAGRVHNGSFDISLISEDVPSIMSFSVQYALQDRAMQEIKAEIIEFGVQKEREKLEEVSQRRRDHKCLLHNAQARSHTQSTDRYGVIHYAWNCGKCNLENQAENMTVSIYESPLPAIDHNLQDAIVFELVSPTILIVLRDALHVLNKDILGVEMASDDKRGTWLEYEPLKRWVSFSAYSRLTTLCSTSKLFLQTHYNVPPHVSSPDDAFIKPNGFNVHPMETDSNVCASASTYKKEGDISSSVTLGVDGVYKCLQWTMGKTSHTENKVLACQNRCPHELNLSEFKAFGALRAGHLLQVRNIARALEMQSLSFCQPSVVNLLSQSLWQTGPPIVGGNVDGWARESNLDLRNEAFVGFVIKQLDSLLERNQGNWKDHLVLLSIVTITGRLLELSEGTWNKAIANVLLSCRSVAEHWLERIEQVLGEMLASPIEEVERIRTKLVEIAAIAALTFDVNDRHVSLVLRNEADVTSWLRTMARIHDNICLNSKSTSGRFQDCFKRNLLRQVWNVALQLEESLNQWFSRTRYCLDDFVSKHWADAGQGLFGSWVQYDSPCERWWRCSFTILNADGSERNMTLQMDTLRGSFLVDGCPVARLPSTISDHEDYKRVFGMHVFQVQPAAACSGSFVSLYKLKGSTFTFALLDNNRLLVKERHRDGYELELFPSRFFKGDLPLRLIEQHSHWILREGNDAGLKRSKLMDPFETRGCILFRPVRFDDLGFVDIEGVPFVLNIALKQVRDIKRGRDLVDMCSTTVQELHSKALHRLELKHFIHVFVNEDDRIVAELPRMGLNFNVDPTSGEFWSCEKPGFFVSKEQAFGALIGLHCGIVLEEKNSSAPCTPKRCMIIPHFVGLLESKMAGSNFENHHVVEMKFDELCSPSFFIYEVDDRMRCLRGPASPTAWLYLALLHAMTSYLLPDPFTGLTGTESALRLLQSPRCWTCEPYKVEAHSILRAIAQLSPTRTWYPKHLQCMQSVEWPATMYSSTSLDAFQLVVGRLIADNARLKFLFPISNELDLLPPQEDSKLSLKYYWRSRDIFGKEAQMNVDLEQHFGGRPSLSVTYMNLSTEELDDFEKHDFLRNLVEAGHTWRHILISQKSDLLKSHLLNCKKLAGVSTEGFSGNPTVYAWRGISGSNFSQYFLNLYNFARMAQEQDRCREFTFLLAFLAYSSVHRLPLSVLHCVAVHARDFKSLEPPVHDSYEYPNGFEFDMVMVRSEVDSHKISFQDWMSKEGGSPILHESRNAFLTRKKHEFERIQAAEDNDITKTARESWPTKLPYFGSLKTIDKGLAIKKINDLFERWCRNKELNDFVEMVEKKVLDICYGPTFVLEPVPLQAPINLLPGHTKQPFCLVTLPHMSGTLSDSFTNQSVFRSGNFGPNISSSEPTRPNCKPDDGLLPFPLQEENESCEIAKKFNNDMKTSWTEHHKLQHGPPLVVEKVRIIEKLKVCKAKSTALWDQICDVLKPRDVVAQALEAAGLRCRVVPVILLPLIMRGELELQNLRVGLGALAVLWTLEQQAERCLRMVQPNKSPQENVALQKELANVGHSNWQPEDHPEWLILELEGDYLMRTVQVDVANKMLHPDGNENVVLQLNMGEGKTSVIVPALCASISNGVQYARLTVLSSLFRMNFDALAFKLGGLLNQRVYTFPYRRDIKIDNEDVRVIEKVYEECVAKRGVVVMRPEHRLSSELKVLELCRSGHDPSLAARLRNLQTMVNAKARDVLDESDLLLHVKYQVVYTVGEQMNLDGGALRWKVSQSVLRSVQRCCESLLQKCGSEAIEFKRENQEAFAFPHIRLLQESLNNDLCKMIADDILCGGDDNLPLRELRHDVVHRVRSFILPKSIADVDVSLEEIEEICPTGPNLDCILILRGLLCYGVLFHALQMRWRVQYGVRPSGIPKMAVPFRAKDVPVERAEYGHPDVAIMLTQISYYKSGLNDTQLLETFHKLHRLSACESEYQRWLRDVPSERVPKTMRTLSSVNLEDFVQRTTIVFPFFRRNMRVIDFWLSTVVFPVEAKQFEGKLVASAWDLSNSSNEGRPVSGFSGTKDTSILLPTSIIQCDLPELQGTDGAVIKKLLQQGNSSYHEFPSCITNLEILERIVESKACVLLDVGALMVDMDNRDVATKWLERLINRNEIEAAIYFDDDNQIMAIDRSGRSGPLHLSPFHQQMSRCVVYLDDVHTRGTDLKIPRGSHACVTLGKGITKDRLVQACMRMRMLGEGHSVSFWASQEVHTSIVSTSSSSVKPTSKDVLRWVIRNTVTEIQHGFRHWGSQGIAHVCKQVIHRKFQANQGVRSLQQLGQLCTEQEIFALSRSYGCERRLKPLPSIMKDRLQRTANNMQSAMIGNETSNMVVELGCSIINMIEQYTEHVECFAHVLDEEQERELEHELEEHQEVQRPAKATPHKPKISEAVRQLATLGKFDRTSIEFLPILEAFKGTKIWQKAEAKAWSNKLFVTREFATVVAPHSVSTGVDFLRPVAWLVVVTNRLDKGSKPQSSYQGSETHRDLIEDLEAIVLLSPFEVNSLMAEFRQGEGAHLHMVAPRHHQGQSFMVSEPSLVLPKLGSKHKPFDDPTHIAQLLGFSGSVFFANNREQDAYCDFLGLCPRPRSEVEENAFHHGDIEQDGYLPPEQRQKLHLKTACVFERSPVPFMVEVLLSRGWVGHASTSHVGEILFMGQRAHIGNVDNPCKVEEFCGP